MLCVSDGDCSSYFEYLKNNDNEKERKVSEVRITVLTFHIICSNDFFFQLFLSTIVIILLCKASVTQPLLSYFIHYIHERVCVCACAKAAINISDYVLSRHRCRIPKTQSQRETKRQADSG